ncbi:hypothetical protein PAF17_16070 [Paracoccus sp. Z330]|uniref:Uncharacterized protein n=1 Tax=Paracoccus onchidii TaxID=3017813 RepID=A0ABT4ZI24_9RHOB|nr:hypothetical protein [Paracoccus onchidii]MDB6179009.1 hypothetical protein [Paracoccus onchidii]
MDIMEMQAQNGQAFAGPQHQYGGMGAVPDPASSIGADPGSFRASNGGLFDLLDQHEGAGGYDTLYGHAQKNGPFSGTKVSNMTVGEAIDFSRPDGAYAQHVKGQVGRIATPMGRGQIVGTTLRRTAEQMGIDPSTPFNAATQDAMINHLAANRLRSARTMDGKIRGLRAEWEGFKHVPDAQLASAITNFENTHMGRSMGARPPVKG